jgi:hypothetical protein
VAITTSDIMLSKFHVVCDLLTALRKDVPNREYIL